MKKYKTRTELAEEYGLSRITFVKEVRRHGIELDRRRLISPAKQEEIEVKFCVPNSEKLKQDKTRWTVRSG